MPNKNLAALLATLTAQLHTANPEEEQALERLQTGIAEALLRQDPSGVTSQEFLFEKSDLFMSANLGGRLEKIDKIVASVQSAIQAEHQQEMQVFVRTVPIRTTQIAGSVTNAAAGSRVATVGPIRDRITGRPIWFDFVKVKKLIPLYVQGQAEPAILFNAEFSVRRFTQLTGQKPEITRNFKIIPDTVWILARLFDPAAPTGHYAGLRVKGGSLTLSQNPQITGDKLTIAAGVTATCNLELEQSNAFASDPSSPYGIDARNAQHQLPKTFEFSFQNNTK